MNIKFEPTSVRYIKLGRSGCWEKKCIEDEHTIMLGYENPHHKDALSGNWEPVRMFWLKERSGNSSSASRDLNQIKTFYEMPNSCLWITFWNGFLYWCFAEQIVTELPSGERVRKTIGRWSNENLFGKKLHIANIDGRVLKVQGFRGTICAPDLEEYIIRKIKGEEQPDIKDALNKFDALKLSLESLIRGLWWNDFELLTDLIFTQSGWQRISILGKTEKDIDLDLMSPVTGKRAFVQVKSQADMQTLKDSISRFRQRPKDQFHEMYFVVHSANEHVINYSEPGINVIGMSKLSELVINAGLVSWLIQKRS